MKRKLIIIVAALVVISIIGVFVDKYQKKGHPSFQLKEVVVESTRKDTITVLIPIQNLRDIRGDYSPLETTVEEQHKGYKFLNKRDVMDSGKLLYECKLVRNATK